MLKLLHYFRSSASYRVRIALHLKQLQFESIHVHLLNNHGEQHAECYKKLNPQGLVPSLVDEGKVLTQSLAIIEYLDEKYPTPTVLPTDLILKAQVRAFALAIACDIHPLNNLKVLKYLKHDLNVTDEQKDEWYRHWIADGFTALETTLKNNINTGEYCFGNTPTLADICLVPQMTNARRLNCELTPYPTLVRIDQACRAHPAFIAAEPGEDPSQ